MVGASLAAAFDDPKTKKWSDSDTIRLGITHELDSRWTLMAGFAYDKTPVPRKYAGYELPDSDSKVYSFGARYRYDDQLSIGAAFLYDDKETLDLTGSGNTESLGTLASSKFTDTAAYLLTMGIEYKF
ncbi:MAG: outer membrane protein transport protein [Candidatus Sedimenticola endophacoides]